MVRRACDITEKQDTSDQWDQGDMSGRLTKGKPEAKISGVAVVEVVVSSSRGAYAQAATREPEQ